MTTDFINDKNNEIKRIKSDIKSLEMKIVKAEQEIKERIELDNILSSIRKIYPDATLYLVNPEELCFCSSLAKITANCSFSITEYTKSISVHPIQKFNIPHNGSSVEATLRLQNLPISRAQFASVDESGMVLYLWQIDDEVIKLFDNPLFISKYIQAITNKMHDFNIKQIMTHKSQRIIEDKLEKLIKFS